MEQAEIDQKVRRYYGQHFAEGERLTSRSPAGRVEFIRVQEILRECLKPRSTILDIGGATGVHAAWLADDGHRVTLIDPVPEQVAQAAKIGTFIAQVGDARRLEFDDDSFDVALMFGPLYHLASRNDRLQAIREARRVVRPGGMIFAAGISRLQAFVDTSRDDFAPTPYPQERVTLLADGSNPWVLDEFPGAHFHIATELRDELQEAGIDSPMVLGVEGPGSLALEIVRNVPEEAVAAQLLLARVMTSFHVADLSGHLLGYGTVTAE